MNLRFPFVPLWGGQEKTDCRLIEPLLDDLVDGRLTAAEQRRVEQHLAGSEGVAGRRDIAGCAACGDRLASLRRLLAQVDALPRSISPESDLWSGLAPRLTARRLTARRLTARRLTVRRRTVRRQRRRSGAAGAWPHHLRQAAAAVAFMTLGGVLSQLLLPAWRGGGATTAVVATVDDGVDRRLAEFALAEADFLRAKEALWSAVYTSHDAASPATREVVERNLAVIAAAIGELRAALEDDPGNDQLEGLLLARHRSEIDLLRRLARSTAADV